MSAANIHGTGPRPQSDGTSVHELHPVRMSSAHALIYDGSDAKAALCEHVRAGKRRRRCAGEEEKGGGDLVTFDWVCERTLKTAPRGGGFWCY